MTDRLTPLSAIRPGFTLHDGHLCAKSQAQIVADVRAIVAVAPLVRPVTPGGRQMSVAMTSAGRVGWITDRAGYRYAPAHPGGAPWPPIPDSILAVWRAVSDWPDPPDCCLVNYYAEGAKMGLHRDEDEGDFTPPVVSISLGDSARFRMGGTHRRDPTRSVELRSGDVMVMGGAGRLAYHGIDRILFGTSPLLAHGGRLNLTLRVVRP